MCAFLWNDNRAERNSFVASREPFIHIIIIIPFIDSHGLGQVVALIYTQKFVHIGPQSSFNVCIGLICLFYCS